MTLIQYKTGLHQDIELVNSKYKEVVTVVFFNIKIVHC